jgi:hypothetical protein
MMDQQGRPSQDNEDLRIVLHIIIPVFKNMPHRQERAVEIITPFVDLRDFLPQFINCGGLEWLTTLGLPNLFSGSHLDYKFNHPIDILDILSKNGQSLESLSAEQARKILSSSIICDPPNDKTNNKLLGTIRTVYQRLRNISSEPGVFEGTANCCGAILNRRILENALGYRTTREIEWLDTEELDQSNSEDRNKYHDNVLLAEEEEDDEEEDFNDWCEDLRNLIRELRGLDVESGEVVRAGSLIA